MKYIWKNQNFTLLEGTDLNFRDPISIVRQSHRHHKYDVRGISRFLLFSFKVTKGKLKYIQDKVIQTT